MIRTCTVIRAKKVTHKIYRDFDDGGRGEGVLGKGTDP